MNFLFSYVLNSSSNNYGVMNYSNMYNFLLHIFEELESDELKREFCNQIKIYMGISFNSDFKNYIFRKQSDHRIISYL